MITHWQNILKGKRMSKRNITFIIMIITLMTLPLSACGKNRITFQLITARSCKVKAVRNMMMAEMRI